VLGGLEAIMRICINPDCGWTGTENECLDYKHPIGARLCPECHENTERLTPLALDAALPPAGGGATPHPPRSLSPTVRRIG
jgi:hypothetical protein